MNTSPTNKKPPHAPSVANGRKARQPSQPSQAQHHRGQGPREKAEFYDGRRAGVASLVVGLGWRAGWRMALELLQRGLTGRERRGRFFYHRLTRGAEDALLRVVAGAQAGVAPV